MQKTAKEKETAEKSGLSPWEGDMVVSQTPSYFGFVYDHSLSGKSKEEMTMDEYKQWFMNEMSVMPVSGWYRSTCVGGALTITEECFERMKSDPEWEKTVLGMVRKAAKKVQEEKSIQNGDDAVVFQSEGRITRTVNAYEENINIFSESVFEREKI